MTIAPDLSTIREAQMLLRNYFGVTPLVRARSLARADGEAWLKSKPDCLREASSRAGRCSGWQRR